MGEVLEGGQRGNLFRYFYLFGGERFFFWVAFTHLVEGDLRAFVFLSLG